MGHAERGWVLTDEARILQKAHGEPRYVAGYHSLPKFTTARNHGGGGAAPPQELLPGGDLGGARQAPQRVRHEPQVQHQEHFRTVVFTKAVARFEKELEAHKAGRADLYRSREERARQLQERGGKSTKDSWFRKTGAGGTRTTSVLKVPYTPGGTLKQQMAKVLESKQAPDGISTRVQEGGGDKLQHALMRPDPFPRSECHRRQTCPITRGEKGCKDNCYQGHVNYTIECTRCWESHCQRRRQHDGDAGGGQLTPRYVYYGETSRGCHVRFSQHITGYRAHSNFMWQHTQDVHDGVVGAEPREDYFMVREALDADPTRRILRESVRISWLRNRSSSDLAGKIVLMNGKDEWFGVKVVQPSFVQE